MGIENIPYNRDSPGLIKESTITFWVYAIGGPIEGGSFHFDMIAKETGKSVGDMSCRWSSTIRKKDYKTWKVDYSLEPEIENGTSNTIKQAYTFDYTLLTVRKNGKTIRPIDSPVPTYYKYFLELDSLTNTDYVLIIQSVLDIDILTAVDELFEENLKNEMQNLNPTVWELHKIMPYKP